MILFRYDLIYLKIITALTKKYSVPSRRRNDIKSNHSLIVSHIEAQFASALRHVYQGWAPRTRKVAPFGFPNLLNFFYM